MMFTLSDGREVDLSRVVDVSSLRDEGIDPQSISLSILAFHVRLKSRGTITVERKYHYADWAKVKKELEQERNALMEKLEEYRSGRA
jgi:hypothetical protein